MKICVIGIGYIGLPTACILCSIGFDVVGVDINENYINILKSNKFKSKEKDLVQMVKELLDNKKFSIQIVPEEADIYIICTPTPLDNDNNPDLSHLIHGVNSIIPYLHKENIIIIGGCTKKCSNIVAKFYKNFVKGEIYITSSEIAEMVKIVENSYRDVNIALVNEITTICNELSINPYKVISFANKHPRVELLNPGIGVGGHCLPIDPYFIINNSPDHSKLIQTGRSVNDSIPKYILSKIEKILEHLIMPKVAVWGITYKGNSDDIRNSPSLQIVSILKEKGYNLSIYDPLVENFSSNDCKFRSIKDANLLVILVEHLELKEENYSSISNLMKEHIIFDAVNIIDKSKLSKKIVLCNLSNT